LFFSFSIKAQHQDNVRLALQPTHSDPEWRLPVFRSSRVHMFFSPLLYKRHMRCLHGIRDATYAWQHGTVLVYCLTAPLWSGDFWLLRNLTIFNKFENHIYVFQKIYEKNGCRQWVIQQTCKISILNTLYCFTTQKWHMCGSEYVYFQISKSYWILSFLCSLQYKEFHIKILHACRLHYFLCLDFFFIFFEVFKPLQEKCHMPMAPGRRLRPERPSG
jgi:hypothetical protein